jgi:hypothetical protein
MPVGFRVGLFESVFRVGHSGRSPLLLLLLQVANIGSIDESGQARPDPLRYSVKWAGQGRAINNHIHNAGLAG